MPDPILASTPPAVLHVITGLEVGGAETALARLVAETRARGGRVLVATLRGGGALEAAIRAHGVHVVAIRRPEGDPYAADAGLIRMLKACREFRPDVVVGWMYHGIALARVLRSLIAPRRPLVWNVRCTIDALQLLPRTTRLIIHALRLASPKADLIVYNSARGRSQHASFGFADSRARVVDNGIDVSAFVPDAAAGRAMRTALGIPETAFVIGHVARFDPMKRHRLFLDAVLAMKSHDRLYVVMAGRRVTRDNPELADLMRRVESSATLHALGERSDVAELMKSFDVFCMSSQSEGFPNVVAEAMASGVPCVVTDAGDAARVVGATGACVPIDDRVAMARAFDEFMAMPEAERAALGHAARTRVRDLFSLETMTDAYVSLFHEVMHPAQPSPARDVGPDPAT